MGTHRHVNVQVARRAAVLSGVALAADIQHLVIVDSRGHSDLQGLAFPHPALAAAHVARLFDDLARAVAVVTGTAGLHHAERSPLIDPYLAGAVAGGTGFG